MRRLVAGVAQKGARVEAHQVAVALLARGEQHDARQVARRIGEPGRPGAVVLVAEVDRERAADDRLDAGTRHLVGELQRPEHVVGVGQRERGLAVGLGELGQPRDRQRALEQRIGRMHVQMHEAWIGGHARLAVWNDGDESVPDSGDAGAACPPIAWRAPGSFTG